jgi:hypothetical protein
VSALYGIPGARLRKSIARLRVNGRLGHPDVVFELLEFKGVTRDKIKPRYQDPGSGAFVLRVRGEGGHPRGEEILSVVRQIRNSRYARVLTSGGEALDQGRRFAVFTQDSDGFIMEFTQQVPAQRANN